VAKACSPAFYFAYQLHDGPRFRPLASPTCIHPIRSPTCSAHRVPSPADVAPASSRCGVGTPQVVSEPAEGPTSAPRRALRRGLSHKAWWIFTSQPHRSPGENLRRMFWRWPSATSASCCEAPTAPQHRPSALLKPEKQRGSSPRNREIYAPLPPVGIGHLKGTPEDLAFQGAGARVRTGDSRGGEASKRRRPGRRWLRHGCAVKDRADSRGVRHCE